MSIRRGTQISLASGLALIVLFSPVKADDPLEVFFEDFENGTVGQDLTELGWQNLCLPSCADHSDYVAGFETATVSISEVEIDAGQSAQGDGRGLLLGRYLRELPGGPFTLGDMPATLTAVLKFDSFFANTLAVSARSTTDNRMWHLAERTATIMEMTFRDLTQRPIKERFFPGQDVPQQVSALGYDGTEFATEIRLDITSTWAEGYHRELGTTEWKPVGQRVDVGLTDIGEIELEYYETDNIEYSGPASGWIDTIRLVVPNGGGPIDGDIDGDSDVDFTDFSIFAGNFTGTLDPGTGDKTRDKGDFDGDGDVDFGDFSLLAGNFTGTITAPASNFPDDGDVHLEINADSGAMTLQPNNASLAGYSIRSPDSKIVSDADNLATPFLFYLLNAPHEVTAGTVGAATALTEDLRLDIRFDGSLDEANNVVFEYTRFGEVMPVEGVVHVVPEPASLMLIIAALALFHPRGTR